VSTRTIVTVKCDICEQPVKDSENQVFVGAYGLDFHMDCLRQVDGTIIGKLTDEATVGIQSEFIDRPAHAPRLVWNRKKTSQDTQGRW